MVPLHSLIAFAGLAFVLVVVPGPSVLFTIGRAITVGRRAALLTVAGNAAGVGIWGPVGRKLALAGADGRNTLR
ncbi:hypothetical protein [Nocardia cyriacigeorgica]|uniref:hypothetical protein n=1 Tax=Nocardia cyriacigeorgica TaxID=135487 RepID=UPI001895A893|nr:hypothetical protein [Nocardia cyriacigeorgica]MBF6427598.1 hypothetical protein [Nocardia cyriacigeorgica]